MLRQPMMVLSLAVRDFRPTSVQLESYQLPTLKPLLQFPPTSKANLSDSRDVVMETNGSAPQ